MTEQEKDELFSEFVVRMAELDREDKRLAAARNHHCLTGMAQYYKDNFDCSNIHAKYHNEVSNYYRVYNCYTKLRAAVPALVMAKKFKNSGEPAAKKAKQQSDNPMLLEEDIPEATKAGKILLAAMWMYLTDDGGESA